MFKYGTMNGWCKSSMGFFLILQTLFLIFAVLSYEGINIPILRQLTSFIFISFIPGLIILQIMRLQDLNVVETVLYSFGLSLTFLTVVGLLMNGIYPLFGINKPLSSNLLIVTLTISINILAFISYLMGNKSQRPNFDYTVGNMIKDFHDPNVLFLVLLPFMAILGTYLVNFHENNILLLVLILSIAGVALLVAFNRFPKRLYPLTIFIFAISVLYHVSLISTNLWGWDIHLEYHLANLVQVNSIWNFKTSVNYNSMLSVTILPVVLSKVCNIGLTWVFKLIYPFFFALVPLGLYFVFKDQTNDKIAFWACFFFISVFVFYNEMLSLARQEIGELFLVMTLLMIVTRMDKFKRTILTLIFLFSLVISHYSLTYIYLFLMFIPGYIILKISQTERIQGIAEKIVNSIPQLKNKVNISSSKDTNLKHRKNYVILSPLNMIFMFSFGLLWYGLTSGSYTLNLFLTVVQNIISSFFWGFLNPTYTQGLGIITQKPLSVLHSFDKLLQIINQLFIVIGLLLTIWGSEKTKFKGEYVALAICSLFILIASILVPNFSIQLNTSRIYHITLIILSPFVIIGGLKVIKFTISSWGNLRTHRELFLSFGGHNFDIKRFITKITEIIIKTIKTLHLKNLNLNHKDLPMQILALFLVVFFLFETGFVYAVTNDYPTSIALSQNNMNSTNLNRQVNLYNALNLFDQDIYSVDWLNQNDAKFTNGTMYVDYISSHPLIGYSNNINEFYNNRVNATNVGKNDFVYLGYPNIVGGIMMGTVSFNSTYRTSTVMPILDNLTKIYSNGASEIYTGK